MFRIRVPSHHCWSPTRDLQFYLSPGSCLLRKARCSNRIPTMCRHDEPGGNREWYIERGHFTRALDITIVEGALWLLRLEFDVPTGKFCGVKMLRQTGSNTTNARIYLSRKSLYYGVRPNKDNTVSESKTIQEYSHRGLPAPRNYDRSIEHLPHSETLSFRHGPDRVTSRDTFGADPNDRSAGNTRLSPAADNTHPHE